ncbi:MAG: phosphonate ABC transporter ATP-binding protein, partial [Wenzhouxiangellaceae bacterium]
MTETSNRSGAIRFVNAGVTYPNGAVGMKNLDLQIEPGEFVVIVGSSGAGKSTLLRAVNGLNQLTSGSVEIDGDKVSTHSGRELRRMRKRVGMIFQDFRLVRRLTVMSNVLIGRLAHVPGWRAMLGLWPQADREIALDALNRVGIADKAWVKARDLSGGQQQRVGIARALAQQPAIILADEPVASLDPVTTHQIMKDLVRINRELGITTLVNLHFLDLARQYGKRIIGLRFGELVYDGSAATVTDDDFR